MAENTNSEKSGNPPNPPISEDLSQNQESCERKSWWRHLALPLVKDIQFWMLFVVGVGTFSGIWSSASTGEDVADVKAIMGSQLERQSEHLKIMKGQLEVMKGQAESMKQQIEANNTFVQQNTTQLQKIAQQNKVTSQGVLYRHATEVSKAFLDEQNLPFAKYYYIPKNKAPLPLPDNMNELDLQRMDILSEIHTDLFENALQHEGSLGASDMASWKQYLKSVYERSAVMRDFLTRYKDTYTETLWKASGIKENNPDEVNPLENQDILKQ